MGGWGSLLNVGEVGMGQDPEDHVLLSPIAVPGQPALSATRSSLFGYFRSATPCGPETGPAEDLGCLFHLETW